jgi:hypothetical protein
VRANLHARPDDRVGANFNAGSNCCFRPDHDAWL